MRAKTYVYIAGPYGDKDDYLTIDRRIAVAREAAAACALNGISYYSPHLNSAHFEVIVPEAPVEFWRAMGMVFVDQAWAILLLPGWKESKGTQAELRRAHGLSIPSYSYEHGFRSMVEAWQSVEGGMR